MNCGSNSNKKGGKQAGVQARGANIDKGAKRMLLDCQMKGVPTLRQLALLAGVSRTTVSLALRSHPSIPPETRDAIQVLAKKEGYRRDPVVATLMNQLRVSRVKRSEEKLAFLTSYPTRDGWKNCNNNFRFHAGVCQKASDLGYRVETVWAKEPGITQARLSKILYTRNIRGVILAPLLRPQGHVSLNWEYFAAVAISQTVVKPDLNRASHSHYQGMILTLRQLRHLGYQRIGIAMLLNHDARVSHGWQAAYLVYYHGLREEHQVEPLLASDWKVASFKTWLDKYKPDVVVSNNVAPLDMLQELHYKVPEDIGYACVDLPTDTTPWSGIDQRPRDVGAAAVDLVVGQLQSNTFGLPECPRSVLMEGQWHNGSTTRRQTRRGRTKRAGRKV